MPRIGFDHLVTPSSTSYPQASQGYPQALTALYNEMVTTRHANVLCAGDNLEESRSLGTTAREGDEMIGPPLRQNGRTIWCVVL